MSEHELPPQKDWKIVMGEGLKKVGQDIIDKAKDRITNKAALLTLASIGVVELGIAVGASGLASEYSSIAQQLPDAASRAILHDKSGNIYRTSAKSFLIIASQLGTMLGVEVKTRNFSENNDMPLSSHVMPALGEIFVKTGELLTGQPKNNKLV